ncbi:hypothetical protein D047_4462, partial [Vibrio parahaemolyticus VPTS-2010_2]
KRAIRPASRFAAMLWSRSFKTGWKPASRHSWVVSASSNKRVGAAAVRRVPS